MGLDDKLSNKAEEMTGKAKEAVGKATDDEDLENEARSTRPRAT